MSSMKSKPAPAPAPLGYLARRTLERRAVAASIQSEFARFEGLRARAAEKSKGLIARELATFKAFEAKYPVKLHKLADASGKWWQHRDLAVLKKHIADRNRVIGSPSYKAIQAALAEGHRRGARHDPRVGWD